MPSEPRTHSAEPRLAPSPVAAGAGRWARVKEVFLSALEQADEERSAFVDRACGGDGALRAEVLSLLDSERAAGSFCETPAAGLIDPEALAAGGVAGAEVNRLPPGTILGPCEITSFLSAGGMGAVYRARHTLLDREVAVKTVSAANDESARRRLLREARHVAGLSHPNICTVHDVGVAADTPYIVMALVEGRPLSEIVRAGLLPLADVLSYGSQVAAALAHAHERGIVHRDLKSSNVVVDADGRAVVLDFGLSRRLPRATDGTAADLTATITGVLAGTLSHMAPEVLFGGEADPRSDIWSLGVLLYELATGALPFRGRTPFETSSAILNDAPAALPRRVPLAVRLVIERCLAKDATDRYQTAAAVHTALEAIRRDRAWPVVGRLLIAARRRTLARAAAGILVMAGLAAAAPHALQRAGLLHTPAPATLALLPLEAADEESALYAAGLTDALTAQLAEAADVQLIARTSATRAAEDHDSPAAAARALGVDAVVTGRVRRTGDRIAVDARLIAAANGRVLWSDHFERSAGQVLALQADIVRGMASSVHLALRPGSGERLATVRAVNPEAYEAYLMGRFEWNQRTPSSLQRAVTHFTRAIELDPTYAPAHAALADCYNQFGTVLVGAGSPREYRPRAIAAAIRALQIDPYSAEAHATLAYARHYDWQFAEAEEGFRRAIELNPSFALSRIWYANLLMSRGRVDEAWEQVSVARELDPFSLVVNTNVGWVLNHAQRYQEAAVHLDRVVALDSTYSQARMRLIDALLGTGRVAEAHAHAHRLVHGNDDWPPGLITLALVHARVAPDSARATLAELLERRTRQHVSTAGIAGLYNELGDVDNSLAWYRRVLEERSNASVYLAHGPPNSAVHGDARFRALLAAAGLN